MESTKFLRQYITFLRLEKPHNSMPFICYLIILSFLMLGGAYDGIKHEQDRDKAIIAISVIYAISMLSVSTIVHSVNPKQVMELISLIEEDFFLNKSEFVGREQHWKRIERLHKKTEKNMKITYKRIIIIVIISFFGFLFKNVLTYLLGIPIYSEDQKEPWLFPFLWHSPAEFEPVAFFVYVYTLQTIKLLISHIDGYLILIATCLSTERVFGDIETFYQLLDSFCRDFAENEKQSVEEKDIAMRANLKTDMARLVRCHQRITRNNRRCSDNSAFMISVLITIVMIESISNVYFILKSNELKKALTFAVIFSLNNMSLLLLYHNGQHIFNQNEQLRNSLAELPWTDKPRWLRQTVHIMMMRANVDLQLRPYGIFVLNYMSFKDMMKFTFSVGNVLYTRKLATHQ